MRYVYVISYRTCISLTGILLGYNLSNSDLMFNQYDYYNAKATKQQILNYVSGQLCYMELSLFNNSSLRLLLAM